MPLFSRQKGIAMLAPKLTLQAHVQNEVLVHLLTRLSSVAVEDRPFPHFFAENIFPRHIYDAMLASLPPVEQMESMGRKHRNGDGTYNRFQIPLTPQGLEQLPVECRELWHGVRHALSSPEFKLAVFGKLKAGLSFRYGVPESEVKSIVAHPQTTLLRETEGYSIAPHPDTRKKIVTMQFALPRDNSQRELGTTFYQRSLAPADWLNPPRGFRTAKQMPFIPNCCYAFVVLNSLTLKSWHGREEIQGNQGIRNSLLHLYYTQPQGGQGYE